MLNHNYENMYEEIYNKKIDIEWTSAKYNFISTSWTEMKRLGLTNNDKYKIKRFNKYFLK